MFPRNSSKGIPLEIQMKLDMFYADLQKKGVFYIGHGVVSDTGNHTGYFSNKEWGGIYLDNNYFFHEPILNDFRENAIDIVSWENIRDVNCIARTRREFTQVTSGVTIYRKAEGFSTFFNMGFNTSIDLVQFTFLKRDLLLAYFHIFNDYHLTWRQQNEK